MNNIKTLFIFVTIAISFAVFSLQGIFNYFESKEILANEIEKSLSYQVSFEAQKVERDLFHIATLTEATARDMETNDKDIDSLLKILANYMQSDKMIFGGGCFYEPFVFDSTQRYYGPYLLKKDNTVNLTWDFSTPQSDYHSQNWYKTGLNAKSVIAWTDPYYDEVLKADMITSVAPVKRAGKVVGVTTMDIGLKEINDYVASIKVGQTGYAFIVSQSGQYLGHPVAEKNMKQKITEDPDDFVRKLGEQAIAATEFKMLNGTMDKKESYIGICPIGDTGMKLVMVMPKSEVFAGLNKLNIASTISFIMAAFLFFVLLTFFFTRKVSGPLSRLKEAANRVAQGDLSTQIPVDTKDEIGVLAQNLQIMVDNLKELFNRIRHSAEQVSAASEELTANVEQSAQASNQVAAEITEVAGATDIELNCVKDSLKFVEQIYEKINRISEQVITVTHVSTETSNTAGEGRQAIHSAVAQMDSIEKAVGDLAEVINKLGNYSGEIGQIVEAISTIAAQTNLLALNAAIEAARAGEAGKGFAVVAEEVRNLAEQSQSAAKQISGLIREIQGETGKAVTTMQAGIKEVNAGTGMVDVAGKAFDTIVEMIRQIASELNRIAGSAQEMNVDSEKLVESVRNIGTMSQSTAHRAETVAATTQEQSATMQEIASASKMLAKLAEDLTMSVNKFIR
ncbi:methyl-accepting chemotaxis protein [Sporomusa acidovorans]|uniref:Methyl-accepting chemotaxis protein McpA n=1 Tax=Sporomusa acidovorans (strain ATCC 49682 / DSM 3132 / Mol) TaxID=1123286 RepID=A0ABZ3J8Q1_SPOA4|nr:methyl-accepting chemotaxis protein [Sporomusa acidovorans]OZC17502.1 methyl-accepting chemotaxis protein McpA [Sporomusa acidovorans DSM 3132]SDF07648.1 methyl-accepting chemotaxis sensory transducer with Cache sensor [Sporomusa acidovorans]